MPPPSPESSAISGEFHVDPRQGQVGAGTEGQTGVRTLPPNKRTSSGPAKRGSTRAGSSRAGSARAASARDISESSVQALEPADSQLITERPPADELPSRAEGPETVPAPSWVDDLDR